MSGPLRVVGWVLLAVAMVVALIGAAGWWLRAEITGVGPLQEARRVVIPPHTGLAGVAERLAREGVVRHALVFEIGAMLSDRVSALRAGEYEFPAGTSPLGAADIIASGKTVKHRLTIPEGLTTAEAIALIEAAPALTGTIEASPPEGSLLPNTYLYSWGEPRQHLIRRMQRAMAQEITAIWAKRQPDLPLATLQQLVILASLVEREAKHADERAEIAAVFINRLRLGMRLECDPTVIYALSEDGTKKVDRPLTRTDLQTPSPYNTYLEKGLPPGPIDNPGLAALRAAAWPAQTDALYFVADGRGGHVFAKTLAEHNRNVAQYRRNAGGEPERVDGVAR